MPYRFAREISIEVNLRMVVGEQIAIALQHALAAPGSDVHEDVHEIRKALKKVRAALRIVRGSLPTYASDNARFRDLGRRLSDVRDAAAVIESVDALRETLVDDFGESGFGELRASLVENRDRCVSSAVVQPLLTVVASELREGANRATLLKLACDGFDALVPGISRTYRRGRKLHESADIDFRPEHFHQWRKRAKYHRYHVELLLGPEHPMTLRVHELTDLLGAGQDVSVVLGMVQGAEMRRSLLDARALLWTDAIEVGAQVYAAKPSDMVSELRAGWY